MGYTTITGRVEDIKKKKHNIFFKIMNVQIVVKKDFYPNYKSLEISKGDIITVKCSKDLNNNSKYRTASPSFIARNIVILSKRLLSEKYVYCNKEHLKRFSDVLLQVRTYLHTKGYIELTLPILTNGETSSKSHSYVTYPYRYKGKLFLRKTMDPFLRILSCYDYEKIFAFGKCFRNEYLTSVRQSEFEMLSVFSNYQTEKEAIALSIAIIGKIIPIKKLDIRYYNYGDEIKTSSNISIDIIKNYPNERNSYASLAGNNITKEFRIKLKGITVVHGLMEIKNFEEYINKINKQGKTKNYGELQQLEKALQYGAPPCYNLGISIARIFTIYYKLDLKAVEPFPLSRLNMKQKL